MLSFRSIYLDSTPVTGRIFDLFDAPSPSQNISLFFVHGGGWNGGSRTIFHSIASAYCEQGFDCASTDYRLGGATVFDQTADVQESLHLFAEDLAHRGRPTDIAVIGSSAGAHLALMAALAPTALTVNYRITHICVQAAPLTMEPWPDIFPAIWSCMQTAVGACHSTRPELYQKASPIYYVSSSMPPVLIMHAENEHMFPRELVEQFKDKAQTCGAHVETCVYPKTEHGFFYSLDRWQQKKAFQDILEFIEAHPSQ